jgi:sulfite exporter TauE/SafE/copper chaperone CopZ
MHCNACVLMTESELKEVLGVTNAKTSLATESVQVTGDFADKTPEVVASELTQVLSKHGYSLSVERLVTTKRNLSEFKLAIPIAIAFVALFILLQKIGIVNLVTTSNVTYGTAFLIGIIASLSTCMAVVGGLLLSMSATFAKEGDKLKPQLLFHGGRLVSFFVLGGIIGAVGSVFTLSIPMTFVLSFVIGVVMLVLGINLLDIFTWTKNLQPAMPKIISKHALGVSKANHALTPLLVGIITFFLPCGFTQSMQIYTLSTGDFMAGALTMFVYALGTLPVLALVSFSSLSIGNHPKSGVFFKSAGLIVILFALFNLINSLVVIGVLPPIFNF